MFEINYVALLNTVLLPNCIRLTVVQLGSLLNEDQQIFTSFTLKQIFEDLKISYLMDDFGVVIRFIQYKIESLLC